MPESLRTVHTSASPRLATRLPALRASLEEQQLVATAAVTSILSSRIDRDDEVALAARRASLTALAAIDAALDRIEHGRYGVCQQCGGPIAVERLDALPTAESCIGCQRQKERGDR